MLHKVKYEDCNSVIKLRISCGHGVGDVGINALYDAQKKVILDTEPYGFNGFKIESFTLLYKDKEVQDYTFINETLANLFGQKYKNMKRVSYLQNNNVQIDLFADDNGFLTKILDVNAQSSHEEEHSDVEHLINNLLTYGINYHTIMSLMEDELEEKSFSKNRDELTNWCKKNLKKEHYDAQAPYTCFHFYWMRNEFSLKGIFKKNNKLK